MCFGPTEIELLGFHVSNAGTRPLQSNVDAILKKPPSASVKDLMFFLGMADYYLKFIPNYAHLTTPLRGFLKSDTHGSGTGLVKQLLIT